MNQDDPEFNQDAYGTRADAQYNQMKDAIAEAEYEEDKDVM